VQTPPQEVAKASEPMNALESAGGMDLDDIQWYHDRPILVRDYAFEEDDERFSKVPLELMPPSERPNQDSLAQGTKPGSSKFPFEIKCLLCIPRMGRYVQ
jgi:hypothetical protein